MFSLIQSWRHLWKVPCSKENISDHERAKVLIDLATLTFFLNTVVIFVNIFGGYSEYLRMNLVYAPFPVLSLLILRYTNSLKFAAYFFCISVALNLLFDIYMIDSIIGPSNILVIAFPILAFLLCERKGGVTGSLLVGLALLIIFANIYINSQDIFGSQIHESLFAIYISAYILSSYCSYHFQTFQESASQKAAQNLRQMHSIIESMGDGLNVLTSSGEFLVVNQKAKQVMGYDPRDYDTKNQSVESWGEVFGIFHSDGKTPIKSSDLPAIRAFGGEVVTNEHIFVRNPMVPEGVHISVTATPMYGENGEIEAAVLAFRDIGTTIKKEHDLRQALQARSIFLANMSHEIRTPMAGIIGAAELMSDEKLTRRGQDCLRIIARSGTALIQILDDILLYSKLEVGKVNLDPKPFNLHDFCQDLVSLYLPSKSEEVELIVDLEPKNFDEKVFIADEVRLGQILGNLLSNALKFTQAGRVILYCQVKENSPENSEVTFKVKDTGIGIEPEKLKLVFKEFEQSDISTTRKYGGTGLGLAISHQLAKLLDARLTAHSELGKGSEFILQLCVKTKKSCDSRAESRIYEQALFDKISVLVVDDNDENQFLIEQFLNAFGVYPTVAVNGQEAINACKQNLFDMIFMDCQMPIVDGYEATEEIRKLKLDHQPYIIALTANALKEERQKCLSAGMDEYLAKPFKKRNIYEALARWQELKG